MQKILFKAKRVEDNEWVYGYIWIGNDHAYLIPCTAGIRYDDETHFMTAYAYEIDKSTICLYTAMHDSDGRNCTSDCPFNIGKPCPAAEGCPGWEDIK